MINKFIKTLETGLKKRVVELRFRSPLEISLEVMIFEKIEKKEDAQTSLFKHLSESCGGRI
jgi:hypothetical protein